MTQQDFILASNPYIINFSALSQEEFVTGDIYNMIGTYTPPVHLYEKELDVVTSNKDRRVDYFNSLLSESYHCLVNIYQQITVRAPETLSNLSDITNQPITFEKLIKTGRLGVIYTDLIPNIEIRKDFNEWCIEKKLFWISNANLEKPLDDAVTKTAMAISHPVMC